MVSSTLTSPAPAVGWLIMLYVGCFAISSIFWLVISEIDPLRVRGLAMGIATMAKWGFKLLVALAFLRQVEAPGGFNSLEFMRQRVSLAFSHRFVPETKGRTLEEITEHWHSFR